MRGHSLNTRRELPQVRTYQNGSTVLYDESVLEEFLKNLNEMLWMRAEGKFEQARLERRRRPSRRGGTAALI